MHRSGPRHLNQSLKHNRSGEMERRAELKSTVHLSQLNFASDLNAGVSIATAPLTQDERDY